MKNLYSSLVLLPLLIALGIQWPGKTNKLTSAENTALPVMMVDLKINFSNAGTAPPSGYLKDFGEPYGLRTGADQGSSTYTYGWISPTTGNPADLTNQGRIRGGSLDVLLATIIHMEHPSTPPTGYWEIELPNDDYIVTISVGDGPVGSSPEVHRVNAEGVNIINDFVPSGPANSATRFFEGTGTVTVADGKLTLDWSGGGVNTKLNYVEIATANSGSNPSVVGIAVTNENLNPTNVDVSLSTTALNLPNGSLNNSTVNTNTVKLFENVSSTEILSTTVNSTGGGDAITLTATGLAFSTTYRMEIGSGVEDLSGASMTPFSFTFTTSADPGSGGSSVEFEKVNVASGSDYTSLTFGPDGKLYGLVNDGEINRWDVNADGTLANKETITSLQTANGGDRLAIGMDFDPAATSSNLILWISHTTFGFGGMADWGGKISKLSGPNLATVEDILVNLPRSTRDHVTNGIDFGPDGKLYFLQGSNAAMGAPDNSWGNRPERLLTAAVLCLDPALVTNPPIDVQTEEGGTYDPFAVGAPLTLFGTGTRNPYDLVWHSNGQLYVPTNGSAAGGNTPETPGYPNAPTNVPQRIDGPYTGPAIPGINNVTQTQADYLFRVVQGGYYGHPNPTRGEYVMNGGNPTSSNDPGQVNQYPEGTDPDQNWRGFAFNFENNKSPNGVIEYKSNTFNGALQGKLLVVRYSGGDDIIVLEPGGSNLDIVDSETGITGFTGFSNPLDLTENVTNGHIYLSEYGAGEITLLRPVGSVGGAPSLSVINPPLFDFNPNEVLFDITKNNTTTESITLQNNGGADLIISTITTSGNDAGNFTPSFTSQTIPAGQFVTLDITFSPAGTVGALETVLNISSNDPTFPTFPVNLYGLSTNGLEGGNEPFMINILATLGLNLNPGFTGLTSNTNNFPLGEEVLEPLFRKVGNGNVELIPIGRYSPDFILPYGYYEDNDDTSAPTLNEVGQLSASSNPPEHQTLFPAIVSGGSSFDPGTADFGLYTTSPSHTAYTEDALNALLHPSQVAHAVRVYPAKDRNENLLANTYLLGFEEASNGDYNDYMFLLTNVEPASTVQPPMTDIRVNVGGSEYTAQNSDVFSADVPSYVGGSTTIGSKTFDVTGTLDDDLYLTYRFGSSFTYDVPVDNGSYDIKLHFAEIFFGAPGGGAGNAGARVFDVTVEGNLELDDLDIFSEVGGGAALIEELTNIAVNDGTLTLEFVASANNAILNAIEIVPAAPVSNNPPVVVNAIPDQTTEADQAYAYTIPANTFSDPDQGDMLTYSAQTPSWLDFDENNLILTGTPAVADLGTSAITITATDNNGESVSDIFELTVFHPADEALRINSGGPDYTSLAGDLFLDDLDNLVSGTTNTSSKSFDVQGTADDDLYLVYRFGSDFTYTIPVENGTYDINLYFAEIFVSNPGQRVFDVVIEGQTLINDLDLVASVGPETALIQSLSSIVVSDNNLEIQFIGETENGLINAIEILPAGAPGNTPPVVVNPIPDQTATENQAFSYVVPANTFSDPDQGDVLTFSATSSGGALPSWLDFDDQTLTFSGTPALGDAGTIPLEVKATDNSNAMVTDPFVLTVLPDPSICNPISPDACSTIPVNISTGFCLEWDGDEGGIDDNGAIGTGFTMVLDPSSNLDPATPSNPAIPGYEPSLLAVSNGALDITATKGILFSQAGNNGNSQVNGLGVGFNANQGASYEMTTTILNLPDPLENSQFVQGGLWFGIDESHYIKLVAVNSNNSTNYKLQMLYEQNNSTESELNTSSNIPAGTNIILKWVLNPSTLVISGSFSIDGGNNFTPVGSGDLTVDAALFNGILLPDATTGPVSFAGVHASIRNSSTPVVFSFDRFCINEMEAPMADLTINTSLQGRSDYSGDYRVELFEPGQENPAYSFTATANELGEMTVDNIAPGTYHVAVKHPVFLQRVMADMTLSTGNNSATTDELLAGDADDDNKVNAIDFSILATTFNVGEGSPGYDGRSDFDGNNLVNAIDFSLLATNFNVAGEEP